MKMLGGSIVIPAPEISQPQLKSDILLFLRFREKDQKAFEFSDRPGNNPFLQEDLGYPELDRFGHHQDSVGAL